MAAYYAIQVGSIDALQFMMRTTDTVMRMLNILGSISLFLSFAALMFKDLESCDNAAWGQNTKRGYFGGIVRRLAGDLTSWSLGAVLTIITVTFLAIVLANTSLLIVAVLVGFVVVLLTWVFIIGGMNILVRRAEPTPLIAKLKTSSLVALAYVAMLVLIFAVIWVK